MDEINFLPNDSWRPPSNGDHLTRASPDPWMGHSNTSPMWPSHAEQLPAGSAHFSHEQNFQRASTVSAPGQPTQIGQHNALPHPDRSLRALRTSESIVRPPAPSIYWTSNLQPVSGVVDSLPEANYRMNMTPGSSQSVREPGHINTGMRGLLQQSPFTADWASSGATSDSLSATTSLFPTSERPRNASEHFDVSSSSTMYSYPLSPVSSRRSTPVTSPDSQRNQRSQACK